jgi:hypothetical protein
LVADLEGQPQVRGRYACGRAERLSGCRVVHEDAGAASREHGRRRRCTLPLIRKVGRHHADPVGRHTLGTQQAAGLRQLAGGAGEQDHAGTGARQAERDGLADAAPGAGDQCGPAGEVSCHCVLLGQRVSGPEKEMPGPFTHVVLMCLSSV